MYQLLSTAFCSRPAIVRKFYMCGNLEQLLLLSLSFDKLLGLGSEFEQMLIPDMQILIPRLRTTRGVGQTAQHGMWSLPHAINLWQQDILQECSAMVEADIWGCMCRIEVATQQLGANLTDYGAGGATTGQVPARMYSITGALAALRMALDLLVACAIDKTQVG